MSAVDVEGLMTLLYTSTGTRRRFIDDPQSVMAAFDLDDAEQQGFLEMDRPGLVLAGNGFAYKRWKSNQWRHSQAYLLASYDDVLSTEDIAPLKAMFADRIATGLTKTRKLRSTFPGTVSDLLETPPENQINYEHVLLEDPRLAPVAQVWRKLCGLNLHHHFLIRAFYYRASEASLGSSHTLHARPGACITYLPLSPDAETGEPVGYVTALMNDGRPITTEALIAGRSITFPADVAQRIDAAAENVCLTRPIDVLCIKTLCAAV
jgi:hypothetical protein